MHFFGEQDMAESLDVRIRRKYSLIIQNLTQVMPITDYLLQEEAITEHDYEAIKHEPCDTKKTRRLLEIVCKKPYRSKTCFVEALWKFSERHIVAAILNGGFSDTELQSPLTGNDSLKLPGNIEEWSVAHVCSWLSSLSFVDVGTIVDFEKEAIDGMALLALNLEDIRTVVSPGTAAGQMLKMLAAREKRLEGELRTALSSDTRRQQLRVVQGDTSRAKRSLEELVCELLRKLNFCKSG